MRRMDKYEYDWVDTLFFILVVLLVVVTFTIILLFLWNSWDPGVPGDVGNAFFSSAKYNSLRSTPRISLTQQQRKKRETYKKLAETFMTRIFTRQGKKISILVKSYQGQPLQEFEKTLNTLVKEKVSRYLQQELKNNSLDINEIVASIFTYYLGTKKVTSTGKYDSYESWLKLQGG